MRSANGVPRNTKVRIINRKVLMVELFEDILFKATLSIYCTCYRRICKKYENAFER